MGLGKKFLIGCGIVTAVAVTGGAALAFCAPALVAGAIGGSGILGCASTGTAIASLHGVALANASLAAIGGGTLAAGGGGAVAGAAAITTGSCVVGGAGLATGGVSVWAALEDN